MGQYHSHLQNSHQRYSDIYDDDSHSDGAEPYSQTSSAPNTAREFTYTNLTFEEDPFKRMERLTLGHPVARNNFSNPRRYTNMEEQDEASSEASGRRNTDSDEESDDTVLEDRVRNRVGGRILEARILNSVSVRAQLEKASVYGQAIALPQLARSANWPRGLCGITARTFLYLGINCFLQVLLLCMIHKEELVMDKFGGQMSLCDFGAFMERCPESSGCTGPTGTKYQPERLYSWNQWVARHFVKDSLLTLFPDKQQEILEKVDEGEYGLEDYWCRLTAIFIFSLAMMEEMLNILRTALLLYHIPTRNECWIKYHGHIPTAPSQEPITHKSSIHLKISGMSCAWKVFNVLIVIVPKAFIFKLTIQAGTAFLMETTGIEEVIVNCVALAFLLTIDEMIYDYLNDRPTKAMMEELEGFTVEEEITHIKHDEELPYHGSGWDMFFPTRLIVVFVMNFYALFDYYGRHCTLREGGSWLGGFVSKPVSTPRSVRFGVLNALSPVLFPVQSAEHPYWEPFHFMN